MGRALICLGDRTSHGGVVIQASSFTSTGGKRIARMGDLVKCPKKGHGTCPIVTGDRTFIVDGKPVARHGDKTACGASLIASQHNTRADTISSPDETVVYDNHAEYSDDDFVGQHEIDRIESKPTISTVFANNQEKYDLFFHVKHAKTGRVCIKTPYKITLDDGAEFVGVTDENGYTEKVSSNLAQMAKIKVPYYDTSSTHSCSDSDTCSC